MPEDLLRQDTGRLESADFDEVVVEKGRKSERLAFATPMRPAICDNSGHRNLDAVIDPSASSFHLGRHSCFTPSAERRLCLARTVHHSTSRTIVGPWAEGD